MSDRAKTGNVLLDAWLSVGMPFASEQASGFERWADMTAQFAGPWSELAQRSYGTVAAMGSLAKAGDPLGDALERSFGVLGDVGPAAAQAPVALAEAAAVASRLFAAREAYRAFMTATWQRAFTEITSEAVRRTTAGTLPGTPAQWLALANSVADRVFVEAFNSDDYLDAQRRLSTALADQRRSEMALVESTAQFGHFPTRRALDELSAEVHELRRRVRNLERTERTDPRATTVKVRDFESADAR